jgi:GDP-L-fucose synthase
MDLVTGAHGFLGRHLVPLVGNSITPTHGACNYLNMDDCLKVTHEIQRVYHLAADVGGLEYLRDKPASMLYKNVMMGLNLLEASRLNGVKEFIMVGSVCEYPKNVYMKEDNIGKGDPIEDTAGYGMAKRFLGFTGRMYRQQYRMRVLHVVFTNLYGPSDGTSHVVAQLARKFCEAKKKGDAVVDVWGNGKATRDLLYVSDAARMLKEACIQYYGDTINLATGVETTIQELAEMIAEVVGFTGEIRYDETKPVGEKRRDIDVTRMLSCKIRPKTGLKEGVEKTVEYYMGTA